MPGNNEIRQGLFQAKLIERQGAQALEDHTHPVLQLGDRGINCVKLRWDLGITLPPDQVMDRGSAHLDIKEIRRYVIMKLCGQMAAPVS